MRNLEEFNGKYNGQIGFIIGSGPSVNMLNLDLLKTHLTISVNSGYLATPWCNFFLSDDWSVSRWSYFHDDLKTSSTKVLLYDEKLSEYADWFGDRSILFKHRKGYHITDSYSHSEYENHICQATSSVGSAIHAAHIMGCRKIGLIGVDCRRLDSGRYFWSGKKKQPYRNDRVPVDRYKKTGYNGVESDTDLVNILKYWNSVSRLFLEKCDIANLSPISLLECFPKDNLENFLRE